LTKRRIETAPSRTAALICASRAVSYLETRRQYHSDDYIAVRLVPNLFRILVHFLLFRMLYRRVFAPPGIYEYVIARTKYIDDVFKRALAEPFDQVLLFGAGFDTRALRFQSAAQQTRIFELDAPLTQQAKLQQYQKRGLDIPSNVVFIAIDFDKESLPNKLDTSGFQKDQKSLFVLEGLLMYLEPESVQATFHTIQTFAGLGSWIVFDYVRASVLRHENTLYGEARARRSVSKAGEQWRFGIEPDELSSLLASYSFQVSDHKDAQELEEIFFTDKDGRLVGRINGTHCIVTAAK
jgi:methyltransferase (TIGR00027 family)